LAEYLGIPLTTLIGRISKGLPQEDWGEEKISYEITYKGIKYASINQLARLFNMDAGLLALRIKKGWPEEKWGEPINNASIKMGYRWNDIPNEIKIISKKLSVAMNISPLDAYRLLIKEIGKEI
tara:strand:- start:212 stop:583 length:372 start_codon:yes stop_codon:yes gene_type:complete